MAFLVAEVLPEARVVVRVYYSSGLGMDIWNKPSVALPVAWIIVLAPRTLACGATASQISILLKSPVESQRMNPSHQPCRIRRTIFTYFLVMQP